MAIGQGLFSSFLPDEQEYLAKNPWFQSGVSIFKAPQPVPTNNTEAFLLPILQGLSGGLALGYGRGEAESQMAGDYRSELARLLGNPDYQLPDTFSPENAKQTLAQELLKQDRAFSLLGDLIRQDPEAGIAAAKNLGVDLGELPAVDNTYKSLREKQIQDINERFNATKAAKEAELQFPGFEYDLAKIRPTASEAAKVRTELENNAKLRDTLAALKDSIDEDGFMNIFGNDAQLQGALTSFIFNTQRKATGSGARLEGPEAAMLKAMTPQVAAGNFSGAIKAALTDRDPSQLATDMINLIDKSENAMMKARFGATRVQGPGVFEQEPQKPNPKDFKDPESYLSAYRAWESQGAK